MYSVLFVALISGVAYGYQSSSASPTVATTINTSQDVTVAEATADIKASVVADDATVAIVASEIASSANLWVAPNVSNLAISAQITEEMPVSSISDTASTDTPQVVADTTTTRDIQEHTVAEGETVDTIAEEYGISKDTIKWANNLTGDTIEPGKVVKILPTDGVTYTVKADDTIEKIAEKYKVSQERLILFNDLELSGVKEGDSIILPSAELPEEERPGYVAPRRTTTNRSSSSSVQTSSFRGGSVGNRYARGWCTWYAYERRAQSGRPVGSFWGNANTWASAARSNGYLVNNTPAAGAVFQTRAGGYGHVGYIESVDYANGTVTYSDMNGKAGWNRVGSETVSLSDAQNMWTFIH